jgi:hypothetical protein
MIKRTENLIFKIVGIALVLILVTSCSHRSRKYIMPEKKFISLLVDLHLAEAIGIESTHNMTSIYKIDSASLYGSVFKKHGVTRAIFDSSLLYYSQRPEKLQKQYNSVTAQLKHLEDEIAKARDKEDKMIGTIIWKSDSVYRYVEGGSRLAIDIPIKDTGIYIVSAEVKMMPEDNSLDPRMSIYFYKDNGTRAGERIMFQEVRYTIRNGSERIYRAVKEIHDTTFTAIRGYVANYSNGDSIFRRNMVIKDLKITRRD